MKNLGWLFYRDYFDFKSIKKSIETDGVTEESLFEIKNQRISGESFVVNDIIKVVGNNDLIKLKTTYPGLLSGSGVTHETGSLGELKLGFCFDYTTGLPYLPGSTIKGNLRHVFPNRLRLQASREKKPKNKVGLQTKADALQSYCCDYLFKEKLSISITPKQLLQFEWMVFEGKRIDNLDEIIVEDGFHFSKIKTSSLPIYESDIFHDAYIDTANATNKILGNDFITPHDKPLKNPIPIQFLKVLPEVTWAFQFDLKDTKLPDGLTITAAHKLTLFRQILLDLGIGAKTNVGYGQLKPA